MIKSSMFRVLPMAILACPGVVLSGTGSSDISAFGALWLPTLIVVALGLLAWWLVRSRGSLVQRDGPMRLVQIMPVGPRERLLLVELEGRRLLVGATGQQLTLLDSTQTTTAQLSDS